MPLNQSWNPVHALVSSFLVAKDGAENFVSNRYPPRLATTLRPSRPIFHLMFSDNTSGPAQRCSVVAFILARFALIALCGAVSARATTVVPPEFQTLVNDSDYIVHAVTKSVSSEKRTGPHGVQIVTHVELEVIEVVAGTPPAKVTLEMLGGRVGDEELTIDGMPRFHVGDEDILFVSGNGRTICPLYGMMHGRYSVATDPATSRKYVARSDGTPLRDTAQIAAPIAENGATEPTRRAAAVAAALDPAGFIRQIKAAVRPDARLNRAK